MHTVLISTIQFLTMYLQTSYILFGYFACVKKKHLPQRNLAYFKDYVNNLGEDTLEKEGVFQKNESKVIRNLLGFKEIKVNDVMTPRSVLETADETQTIVSFYEAHKDLQFSRITIYAENPDEIKGYFLKANLLEALVQGKCKEPLSSIKRDILITDIELSIPDLFDKLIKEKEHIALVVD